MAEPLTLAEAKLQIRKTDTSEDLLITADIIAAREWVEDWTGVILVSRTETKSFLAWGDYIKLPYQPITELVQIDYTDVDGETVEYTEGVLRNAIYPAAIYPPFGASFPTLGVDGIITVQYTVGYESPEDVPERYKKAMKLLIGHWAAVRSGVSDAKMDEVPLGVKSLCSRVPPLA